MARLSWILMIAVCALRPALAQHLSHCDWKLILTESQHLVTELERSMLELGDSTLAFEDKADVVKASERLFSGDAAIRSDVEPNPVNGQILRSRRLDTPVAYMNNVPLYYQSMSVRYEDLQVSYMKLGERLKKPEVIYEFRRVLTARGTDDVVYEDVVDREISFQIKKTNGEWVPFIGLYDYDAERFGAQEARRLVDEVDAGCRNEESEALAQARAAEEDALKEAEAAAEEELEQIAANEALEEEQRQEEIRRIEEEKQREIEERERAIAELRRREAVVQRRLRLKARRKRLFAPMFYLGFYAMDQPSVRIQSSSGEKESGWLGTLGGGVDLAYLKADFSITVKDESLARRSIAEGGFPVNESVEADSVGLITGAVVAGLPLMIGKEFVFFAGGGGMFIRYLFSNANDEDIGAFDQFAPIAQASLMWVLPERGGGISLFYRKSFNAKFGDFGALGVGFHFYPEKKR